MRHRVIQGAVAAAASAVLLAGCSGGTSKPDKAAFTAKVAADSTFTAIKGSLDSAKYDTLVGCFADYFYSKGRASDLKKYVDGKESLMEIKGHDSSDNAEKVGKDCMAKVGLPTS